LLGEVEPGDPDALLPASRLGFGEAHRGQRRVGEGQPGHGGKVEAFARPQGVSGRHPIRLGGDVDELGQPGDVAGSVDPGVRGGEPIIYA